MDMDIPTDRRDRAHRSPVREVAFASLMVLAYLACEWLSEVHEYKGLPVTAWNPGLGLLFAAMMHRPALGAATLFVGIVLAEVLVVHSILDVGVISAMAATSAVSYALFAYLARRHLRIDLGLERLPDVAGLLIGGCLAAVTNAALLTLLLILVGHMTWNDLLGASLPLLIGDLIGIAVVTPPALRWMAGGLFRHGSPQPRFVASGIAVIGLVIGVLLWVTLRQESPAAIGYLFVLFLPVIASALWFGLDGACVSLMISQVLSILLLHLFGYDAWTFTSLQALITVLGATGLLCGTVVTERNAATHLAKQTRARLAEREAEAVRADRFCLATGMTSTLSHEITQPITAARAQARAAQIRLATSEAPEAARVRDHLREVVMQIDLAADILARMRAFIGRGAPERQPADVTAMIDDALVLIGPHAARHHVRLETACDISLPPAPCDRVQIQQVLMNLVGNAINAIGDGSVIAGLIVIRATAASNPERVVFAIHDNGPGVPPELAPRVFEPLMTTRPDGLGLGLSICALIVEAHGGRIWLESTAPGATEFRFTLPLAPSEAPDGR
jgi:signal transduction histidine kinase